MSDHAPGDVTASHDVTDHPTTQFRPYQHVNDASDKPADAAATGSIGPRTEAPETRSFGGFRTERRFSDPVDPWPPAPAETPATQQSWTPGASAGWVPQPMENPAPVYYGGNPGWVRSGDRIAPPTHRTVLGPVHHFTVASGQAAAHHGLAPTALCVVRPADQRSERARGPPVSTTWWCR